MAKASSKSVARYTRWMETTEHVRMWCMRFSCLSAQVGLGLGLGWGQLGEDGVQSIAFALIVDNVSDIDTEIENARARATIGDMLALHRHSSRCSQEMQDTQEMHAADSFATAGTARRRGTCHVACSSLPHLHVHGVVSDQPWASQVKSASA